MAYYSYKRVCLTDDFLQAEEEWEQKENDGQRSDLDPNYNGDNWVVADFLLKKKQAEIYELVRWATKIISEEIEHGYTSKQTLDEGQELIAKHKGGN